MEQERIDRAGLESLKALTFRAHTDGRGQKMLSLEWIAARLDPSSDADKFLISAVSSALRGDVGAVVSDISFYREKVLNENTETGKGKLVDMILSIAYENGVERYLEYAEHAICSGRLNRAGEWLMSVKDCIEKGKIIPNAEQQKRIGVLMDMVLKVI